jgi:hypothetical protein
MEYIVLIYADEAEDAKVDWAERGADYEAFTKALVEGGVMQGGKRLQSSVTATTVAIRDGEQLITDGPFAEAREQLGGFYVLECADLDEALRWAARCPGANHGTVEVRPVAPN